MFQWKLRNLLQQSNTKNIYKSCLFFNVKFHFFENYKINTYNGVLLTVPEKINYEKTEIKKKIKENLELWEQRKYSSATITIPAEVSYLIKYFVDEGFTLHHTLGQNVVICKWLSKKTKNKIPEFAHHYVGIGAIIVNRKSEILLVKEQHYEFENYKNYWKFVTGLVNEGEDIKSATLREIHEEIGLTTVNYIGNLSVRDCYPSKTKNDLCFFNLCSIDEDNSNSKFKFNDKELVEARFFSFKELDKIENLTEMSIFNIEKLKARLEEYKQNPKNQNCSEDIFDVLKKICRTSQPINTKANFKWANVF